MRKHTIHTVLLGLALLPLSAIAQGQITTDDYHLAEAMQLWHNTQNAAALAYDSTENRGVASATLSHTSGDYHLVQEGHSNNRLTTTFDRYQRIGQYLHGYGSFSLDMGRIGGRAWNDWYRAQSANPYTSGSSVLGKYDYQNFSFTASLGTIRLGAMTYGLRLDYGVGDLSRLRDPRSRTTLLDYRLTPSLTWHHKGHTLGIAGSYDRRKEKLLGLTTVQNDAHLMYYTMTGLDQATGGIGAYNAFTRQMVWHNWGFELSHGYTLDTWRMVNTLSLHRGNEYVYGTYKQSPGKYATFDIAVTTRHRWRSGGLWHSANATWHRERGRGDEYRQERVTTRDSLTGHNAIHYRTLITYPHRYRYDALRMRVDYRLYHALRHYYLGGSIALDEAKYKHLLPTSTFHRTLLTTSLQGGLRLWQKHQRYLRADGSVDYTFSLKSAMALANANTTYATQVWQPLQHFYAQNYVQGRVSLHYECPILVKGSPITAFVRLQAQGLRTKASQAQQSIGVTFGVHY